MPRVGRSQEQHGVSHNYESTQYTTRRSGETSCAGSDEGQSSNGGESGIGARPGQDEDGVNSDDGGDIDSDKSPIGHTHSFTKGFGVNNGKKNEEVGMGKLPKQPSNAKRMETGNRRQKDVDNGKAKKEEKQKQKEFVTQKEAGHRRQKDLDNGEIIKEKEAQKKRRSSEPSTELQTLGEDDFAVPATPLRQTTVSNIQTPNPNTQGRRRVSGQGGAKGLFSDEQLSLEEIDDTEDEATTWHRGETKLKTITVEVS